MQLLQATHQRRRHILAHRSPPCSVPVLTWLCHSPATPPLPEDRRTGADPPPLPSPDRPVTTVCHYPAASAPLAHSPDNPAPAASPGPLRLALPPPAPPTATAARTPDPHAQPAAPAARHRPADKSPSGTYPRDTRTGRTPQASAPASRSHGDNRS